jgi:hypothetical protein
MFDISQSSWDETGAFDAFVGLDAPLYIDPFLLNDTSAEELKDAKAIFDAHFSAVFVQGSGRHTANFSPAEPLTAA